MPYKNGNAGLSPVLGRRLEAFIARKELQDAGVLADFMTNVAGSSSEDKLEILAAVDIKVRLETAIEILAKQVASIKSNVRVTSFTRTTLPSSSDLEELNRLNQERMRRGVSSRMPLPSGPSNGRRPGDEENDEESNELEELKKKLEEAKLSPEAAKVAAREMKRLHKINPAQADYQVCRNYLENLSEIPWTLTTEDHLGVDTLPKARRQLDDDHYGLEKVKKRLLEYLAVLKLKQSVNDDVDAQITKVQEEEAAMPSKKDGVQEKEEINRVVPSSAKIQILQSKRMVDKSPILLLVGPPGVGIKPSIPQTTIAYRLLLCRQDKPRQIRCDSSWTQIPSYITGRRPR